MLSFSLNRSRFAVSLLAGLCALVSFARAQSQSAPKQDEEDVVRISTELVQTDVMVFDKAGKFVDGLKPEQFDLKVDGHSRQIAFFDRVQAGSVNEDAQLAAARGAGGHAASGAALPLDRGRTVIFFVDDLHLSAGSVANIRGTLHHFIEDEIGQNDVAAVVSPSGQIGFLQQFTDNKAVLRAAASRINTRPYSTRDGQTPPMSEAQALSISRNDNSVLDFFVDALIRDNPLLRHDQAVQIVQARAHDILIQSESIAVNTISTLRSVVLSSSPLPGRKILFFISEGFVVDEAQGTLRDRMRSVTDAAARAGVVIYSLDAKGLRTGMVDASEGGAFDPGGRLSLANMGEASEMQSPLFTLANETGGRALINTNALTHSVSVALKETSLYYLLAWKPAADGGDAKYRHIEVSVRSRPDLHVIVRHGFFGEPSAEASAKEAQKGKGSKNRKQEETPPKADGAAADQQKSEAEREIVAALRAPLPRAGVPTALALGYVLHPQEGDALLTTLVEVDRSGLTFDQAVKPRALFELLCAVIDDRGKTISSFGKTLAVTTDPAVHDPRQNVVVSFQTKLAPGLYQIRVATRDAASGRTGSSMQWVEIPAFDQGKLLLSSIFLGSQAAGEGDAAAQQFEQSLATLNVDRRFARNSSIRFLTYIYNAAGGETTPPDVALQVQVFRDNQPVFTAPLSKIKTEGLPDASRIPYLAELPLESFPSGRYVLQLTAIDRTAKTSASQRTSFVVE
ncbi:MAG TPA: VWA domain-containing protein [Pyrinomonadaceae bacterium]|nr:VWA domain-containing protein [Pyrinomonadaceae bacterium]